MPKHGYDFVTVYLKYYTLPAKKLTYSICPEARRPEHIYDFVTMLFNGQFSNKQLTEGSQDFSHT